MIAPLRPLCAGGYKPRSYATLLGLMQSPRSLTVRFFGLSALNRQPEGGRFLFAPPRRGAGGASMPGAVASGTNRGAAASRPAAA